MNINFRFDRSNDFAILPFTCEYDSASEIDEYMQIKLEKGKKCEYWRSREEEAETKWNSTTISIYDQTLAANR